MSSMEVEASAPNSTPDPASTAAAADTAINQTIYVQNLNEKIKIDELKKSLYLVFSQFGNIVEINTRKTYKLRGQAWIIFDQLASATRALREMQGFAFYGKNMRVSYAKVKSDVVSKADGTFQPRPKRKTEEEKRDKKRDTSKSEKHKEPSKKKLREEAPNGHAPPPPIPPPAPLPRAEPTPPNNILFVENLPKECTEMMLSMLFQQYQGFQQARLVPGKPGIAFVEFLDPYQSGLAMDALQNFKITANNLMKISFAKK